MKVKLVVERGRTKTRAVQLQQEETVIGRSHGCGLRIASAEISRRHCLLRSRNGYVTVEDLGSSNGTYVNDTAVKGQQVVRPGDRLRLGPVTFVVEYQLTPEGIDRLLQEEAAPAEAVPEAVPLPESPSAEADDLPLAVSDEEQLLPAFDQELHEEDLLPLAEPDDLNLPSAEGWQLPQAEELRDILTGLEDDPNKPRK
jgi:pSer/pThr/pTyr-binding forkhead associated (FHA) protein